MAKYALKRILVALPLLFVVSIGAFGLVYMVPGDSAAVVAGESASRERIAEVREQLGLNDSFFEQYWRWLTDALGGDFGTSIVHGQPVVDIILDRSGVTFSLVVVGLILSVLIGIPAGVAAGARAGSRTDRVITALTTLGIAIPAFWLAMLLVIVFAISLRIFDATGYTPLSEDPLGWLYSMALPGLAIAAASAADIARQTRASMADSMQLDHIRTGYAMGFTRRSVVYRHALRHAGPPIATVVGLQVERLLGAVVVVEIVFAMPGLGTFLVNSAQSQDVPVIQGIIMLIAIIVILVNLIVDLSYAWISPRLRKVTV